MQETKTGKDLYDELKFVMENFSIYLEKIIGISTVARQAMQWNPLDRIGRKKGRPCETWRRTVGRERKNLNKTWPDLKQLAQSRVRWRVDVVDALCPGRNQGNKEEEKNIDRRNTSNVNDEVGKAIFTE